MNSWSDASGKYHRGFIDKNDEYMKLRMDEPQYADCSEKIKLFNFKKDKLQAYERMQSAINQGLVIFPKSLNVRNEIEFEQVEVDGTMSIRYEKASLEDIDALIQFQLAKEELACMTKVKKPNGTVVIDMTAEAKSKNVHDDRADVVAMLCDRLMELRGLEVLEYQESVNDFSKVFGNMRRTGGNNGVNGNSHVNPFAGLGRANPFTAYGGGRR